MDFSVIMNIYHKDNAEYFRQAVESILSQTVLPDDIVLVIDGPIGSELEEVVSLYKNNPLFNIIRLEKNSGLGIARGVGLDNCKNEIVAVMDADDIALPDRFERELKVIAEKDVDVVGSNITEFSESIDKPLDRRNVPETDKAIKKYIKKRCPMNHMTVMFKKSVVKKAGGYQDFYYHEDYFLWIRMFLAGARFYNIQDCLVFARINSDTFRRRGGVKFYKEEKRLQKFMLKNKVISFPRYVVNVFIRFVVEVIFTNKIRELFFKLFARKKV